MDACMEAITEQAISLLDGQLRAGRPSVMHASLVLGLVQDALLARNQADSAAACKAAAWLPQQLGSYVARYQEVLLQPAAARLAKAKTVQDKVITISKVLWSKLQKVPSSKQPLHQQYLTCALRESGKRRLDCLGIATAVLALCHDIAARHAQQHGQLGTARLMVSDDHCWIVVAAEDGVHTHIEVTDCRVVPPEQLTGWLYASGQGVQCSSQQVVLLLAAALAPEEVKEAGTAAAMRAVQKVMLERLSGAHPEAMLYSTHFRWGMVLEEDEVAALQRAADAGDMALLRQLVTTQSPASQKLYARSAALSTGRQWNPVSCAAFGRLFHLQAALCGTNEDGLAAGHCSSSDSNSNSSSAGSSSSNREDATSNASSTAQAAAQYTFELWQLAQQLMQQAINALAPAAVVLHSYAGLHHKQRDATLGEAIRDLFENQADAAALLCEVLRLKQVAADAQASCAGEQVDTAAVAAGQGQPVAADGQQPQAAEAAAAAGEWAEVALNGAVATPTTASHCAQQCTALQPPQLANGACSNDAMPAGGTGAARSHAAPCSTSAPSAQQQQGSQQQASGGGAGACGPSAAQSTGHYYRGRHLLTTVPSNQLTSRLDQAPWLAELIKLMDAVLVYLGDEQAADEAAVDYFLAAAACYSPETRRLALAEAQPGLASSRMMALEQQAWAALGPEVKQQIQMPGNRSRKRARR